MASGALGAGASPRGAFPKAARVRKRREYLEIQARGRRVSLRHFVFVITARDEGAAAGARLGVTASRKVGNAVVRNRCKRLVREAFRALREQLFAADIDVVVIVKQAPAAGSLAGVVGEWLSAGPALSRRIEEARRGTSAKDSARPSRPPKP